MALYALSKKDSYRPGARFKGCFLKFLRIAMLGESNSEPKSDFLDDRNSRSLSSIPSYPLSLAELPV